MYLCAADDSGVNFIKDVLANYSDFRLGRVDKVARRVVVECGFVIFQGDKLHLFLLAFQFGCLI